MRQIILPFIFLLISPLCVCKKFHLARNHGHQWLHEGVNDRYTSLGNKVFLVLASNSVMNSEFIKLLLACLPLWPRGYSIILKSWEGLDSNQRVLLFVILIFTKWIDVATSIVWNEWNFCLFCPTLRVWLAKVRFTGYIFDILWYIIFGLLMSFIYLSIWVCIGLFLPLMPRFFYLLDHVKWFNIEFELQ